ncbi:MAG: hypothetical protein ACP5OP_00330 [Leptospirillia bacterium]
MTISGAPLFLLGVRIYSLINILLSAVMALFEHPRLSTPLFEFPLLAILHLLILGGILPLLMIRWFEFSLQLRMGLAFSQVGAAVLIVGFFLHPRSALPMEGGLLVAAGILISMLSLHWTHRSFRFWFFLWSSAVFGVFLGGVLARPAVDPIPFSAIVVHAMLGSGLGLFSLGWLRREGPRYPLWEGASLLFMAVGVGLVLRTTLLNRMMVFLVAGAFVVLLEGVSFRGRILAVVLSGVCVLGATGEWFLPGEWISALAGSFVLGGLAGLLVGSRSLPSRPLALFQ